MSGSLVSEEDVAFQECTVWQGVKNSGRAPVSQDGAEWSAPSA